MENINWTIIFVTMLTVLLNGGIVAFFTIKPSRKKAIVESRMSEFDLLNKEHQAVYEQMNKRIDMLTQDIMQLRKLSSQRIAVIRQAYKCKTPWNDCPVLLKQYSFDKENTACDNCDKKET